MLDHERAARVRLLVLDVDGVLTDNAVYLGAVSGQRVEFKRFDIQDGLGMALVRDAGIEVAWLSARPSPATALRADELGIATCLQVATGGKLEVLQGLLAERGLGWDEVAYVGDDLADVPLLRRVGLPIAVANAVGAARELAAHVTTARGGAGAVREVVEALLEARGEREAAMARYLARVGDPA